MHPFFAPLDEYEITLLLTTLTVGGSDQVEIFRHLPAPMRDRLVQKANALVAISGDKRVPLMVRELKAILAGSGRRGVERCDPSWIVHGLRGESSRVVATVLIDMPPPVVRSVLKRLPGPLRQSLPAKDSIKHIDPAIATGMRQLFEARFHPMPAPPFDNTFGVQDIIHLERQELYSLVRDLGLVELGQAFVSVGKMALLELCRRLPRDKAAELIRAVRSASQVDIPDPKSAQRFLSRVVVNFEDTEEFFQKSGLWRLAKAMRVLSGEFLNALAQRMPRKAGEQLLGYVDKAAEMEDLAEDAIKRLQDAILVRLQLLAKRGVINQEWLKSTMSFHDPAAAAVALQESEKGQSSDGSNTMEQFLGTAKKADAG